MKFETEEASCRKYWKARGKKCWRTAMNWFVPRPGKTHQQRTMHRIERQRAIFVTPLFQKPARARRFAELSFVNFLRRALGRENDRRIPQRA